jgi:hypothetical protein
MLIVPEIESVIIQPPRTGSTALRDAVLDRYPKAITLFRHMERPGIPMGYENWNIFCLVRDPFDRLVSIYNYMTDFRPTSKPGGGATAEWIARMSGDTNRPFADWLEQSTEVFTDPVDTSGQFLPYYNICDPAPIARKSQGRWARPDLGPVTLVNIADEEGLARHFDIEVEVVNRAVRRDRPVRCARVEAHLDRFFNWDAEVTRSEERAELCHAS